MEMLQLSIEETSVLAEITKDFINAGFHERMMGKNKDWEVNLCHPSINKFLEFYQFETSIPHEISFKREFLENTQFLQEITLHLMKYFAIKYMSQKPKNIKRKEITNLGGWISDKKVWNDYVLPTFL